MKWYKHQANAHRNKSIIKLTHRYGTDGYAIYWYCLELICDDLGREDNIKFELKHDAETIGIALKVDQKRVEEIMVYMVNLGLFENHDGVITCIKLAKYMQESQTRSPFIKKVIAASKAGKTVDFVSDSLRQSETVSDCLSVDIDIDIDREEPKDNSDAKRVSTRFKVPTITEVAEYIAEKKYALDAETFWHHYEARGWVLNNGKQMKKWKSAVVTWNKNNSKFGNKVETAAKERWTL